jgi:hypothetical protein
MLYDASVYNTKENAHSAQHVLSNNTQDEIIPLL